MDGNAEVEIISRDNKTGDVNRTERSKGDPRALQQRYTRISDQRAE